MNIPSGVATTLVKGTFLRALVDSADAGREPDAQPLAGGKVRLRPSVDFVRYGGAANVALALTDIYLTLDANGVLRDQPAQEGVTIPASDQAIGDPAAWTWEFRLTHPDTGPLTHRFVAVTGATIDLSSVRGVPSDPVAELGSWMWAVAEAERIIESGRHLFYPLTDVSGNVSLAAVDRNAILHWRLTGNVVISALPPNPFPGQTITLVHRQDGVGSRTITVKTSETSWAQTLPTSTAANAKDESHLWFDGVSWKLRPSGFSDGTPAGWTV